MESVVGPDNTNIYFQAELKVVGCVLSFYIQLLDKKEIKLIKLLKFEFFESVIKNCLPT